MKSVVHHLLDRRVLSYAQCHALFSSILHAHFIEQASVLALFAAKQETADELLAIRDFLLQYTKFDHQNFHVDSDTIVDMTGTGGDGLKTFNISTAASLVVASLGIPVVKHGGGRVTSTTGSADVIEHLCITESDSAKETAHALESFSYAFLRASQFNSVFDQFKTVRRMLGFPTLLNILGPLINPVSPKRLVLGVYRASLVDVVADVLVQLGVIHALVVHAQSGLDEFCVCSETRVSEIHHGQIKKYTISAESLGLPHYSLADLSVTDAIQSACVIRDILGGQLYGAKRDAVLLNAAAGFVVADVVENLNDGLLVARELIDNGKTACFLQKLTGGYDV